MERAMGKGGVCDFPRKGEASLDGSASWETLLDTLRERRGTKRASRKPASPERKREDQIGKGRVKTKEGKATAGKGGNGKKEKVADQGKTTGCKIRQAQKRG